MKPTVISAANASSSAPGTGGSDATGHVNAVNIPINHEYSPHYANAEANANSSSYGSPNSHARQQQQHQIPGHFQQGFGFEPDMDIDMDMFPRGRLGRMHHDPFSNFGSSHFGFPQFGSMGRRRMPTAAADATIGDDGDFFNRLPSEFRQYIPEGFGHRRAGSGAMPHHAQQQMPPQQHYQYHPNYAPGSTPPNNYSPGMPPQTPSKKLCDAAIQTEDSAMSQDQVDHAAAQTKQTDHLNQHGLRNTVDMGVKAVPENEQHNARSHSAPPPEQMQQNPGGTGRHATPPQQQQHQQTQFGTQTSPQASTSNAYQKSYYAPHQQAHPQQKQQTPPPSTQQQPQTPGGTYVRTIPIFVEGRSEPVINSHKEIPNQNAPPQAYASASASASAKAGAAHPQYPDAQQSHPTHQQRPTPLNTQQQQPTMHDEAKDGPPPQTPHTMASINKIQDIQRDVLELMGQVEKFTGTRQDKEYAYLDEMLTRNLLKLDTIDTNGKDSIRLARKEAIKCIQASINVLEAKAEENLKRAQSGGGGSSSDAAVAHSAQSTDGTTPMETANNDQAVEAPAAATANNIAGDEPKQQEAIPLPPPPSNEKQKNATNKEASPSATVNNTTEEASSKSAATTESK